MKSIHQNRFSKIHRSFTLVEVTVVMTIVIILLSIGFVSLRGMMGSSSLGSATRQVFDHLTQTRSNAITNHKRTRMFIPIAARNNSNGWQISTQMQFADGSAAVDPNPYRNQSYIIADLTYDPTLCVGGEWSGAAPNDGGCTVGQPRGYRWVARTPWQFLPKGAVFDSDVRGGSGTGSNITYTGTWGGTDCILTNGGQTGFPAFEIQGLGSTGDTPRTSNWLSVSFFVGASRASNNQTVLFGADSQGPWGMAGYVEFSPTGGITYQPTSNPTPTVSTMALKIVEGVYSGGANTDTYTNQNSVGGPANYSIITIDKITGRIRTKKPGGPEGGC